MLYRKITSEEAKNIIDSDKNVLLLDVRNYEEYEKAHIRGALLLPLNELLGEAHKYLKNKDQLIMIYCEKGVRSKIAFYFLHFLAYKNLYDIGGLSEWPYELDDMEEK